MVCLRTSDITGIAIRKTEPLIGAKKPARNVRCRFATNGAVGKPFHQ